MFGVIGWHIYDQDGGICGYGDGEWEREEEEGTAVD
jgi:hypothetical protein